MHKAKHAMAWGGSPKTVLREGYMWMLKEGASGEEGIRDWDMRYCALTVCANVLDIAP